MIGYTKADVAALMGYLNTTLIDEIELDGFQIDLIIDALIYYEDNLDA